MEGNLSRKFLKNQFPTENGAKAAAVAFRKKSVSMLESFENMKGKAR